MSEKNAHKSVKIVEKMRPFRYRTQKGMALVFALVLVPILLLLASTFIGPIVRSYQSVFIDQKTLLAKNASKNFVEVALWETKDIGTGESRTDTIDRDYPFGAASGQWWVFGGPEIDEEHVLNDGVPSYTIPAPGSGDVGSDYCDTRDPVVTTTEVTEKLAEFGVDKENDIAHDYDVFDWPCHWGKIHEGETIAIPLYVELGDGTVYNPPDTELDLDNFELYIRPPCDPSLISGRVDPYTDEICADNERFMLAGGAYETIALWQIVGEEYDTASSDLTGLQYYLSPAEDSMFLINTNIYTDLINQIDTSALTFNSNTQFLSPINIFSTIGDHLFNIDLYSANSTIHKPVLRLMVVTTLRESSPANKQIPYLEYQFRTQTSGLSTQSISNVSKIVRVEVMIDGGYSDVIEKNIPKPKPLSGYVIKL